MDEEAGRVRSSHLAMIRTMLMKEQNPMVMMEVVPSTPLGRFGRSGQVQGQGYHPRRSTILHEMPQLPRSDWPQERILGMLN
jgi:hypothetical protein